MGYGETLVIRLVMYNIPPVCVSYRYHNVCWNIFLLMDTAINSDASDVALQIIFRLSWASTEY